MIGATSQNRSALQPMHCSPSSALRMLTSRFFPAVNSVQSNSRAQKRPVDLMKINIEGRDRRFGNLVMVPRSVGNVASHL